jgi:hypothetical protein
MKRPSAAMIVALAALFVALSGTAVAGSGLISGTSIKNGTISAEKLTPNAIRFLHGLRGPQGPQGINGNAGPAGPAGVAGAAGTFASANVQVVNSGQVGINPGSGGQAVANCPAGTKLIGGGMITGAAYIASAPAGNGWLAGAYNTSSSVSNIIAYAICAS